MNGMHSEGIRESFDESDGRHKEMKCRFCLQSRHFLWGRKRRSLSLAPESPQQMNRAKLKFNQKASEASVPDDLSKDAER
jgi:hypothetical protein